MTRHWRALPLLLLRAALLLGLAGCHRGCLSSWFKAEGIDQAASAMAGKGNVLVPPETPCPGGLARCSGGMVKMSRSFTPPAPCSPEGCRCPWDDAATCARGCVLEAVEVDMPREAAVRQLCAPAPGAPSFSRPPMATDRAALGGPPPAEAGESARDAAPPEVASEEDNADDLLCDAERYRCTGAGVVVGCEGGAHVVGVCNAGCADGERMVFAGTTDGIAQAILCKR